MSRFEFSNFMPFDLPMDYYGIVFKTVENFYQAMKTKDIDKRKYIATITPEMAKRYARKMELRPDWEQIKEQVMLYALRYKFTKNTEWGKKLIATGNKEIIEYNYWHDNYWGVCNCGFTNRNSRDCKNGKNRLGVLLMQVREEINK